MRKNGCKSLKWLAILVLLIGSACGSDDEPLAFGEACEPDGAKACEQHLTCAERASGGHACFNPIVLSGLVFDLETGDALKGAHVLALNEEATAVSDVAISAENGTYSIAVPARRDAQGKPVQQFYTLRASAQDYQTFPGGIRTALPVDASSATDVKGTWVISTPLTEIGLLELPDSEQGLPAISGKVLAGRRSGGVLVVAESGPQGYSAVSDLQGRYTIFNVPSGSYNVRGYAADVQVEPVDARVESGDLKDVDLVESDKGLADVSGKIQIVAATGATSVVLVVASTFDEVSERGEVPSGLRAPRTGAPSINGDWTIKGVPAGDYVVLASFENDQLVRDPDTGISGTEIVRLTVPANAQPITIEQSFKVTAALTTVSPGSNLAEQVTGKPELVWGPMSNADKYSVIVFDAFGEIVWSKNDIPPAGGNSNIKVAYDGPLDEGMYYQFRATAHRKGSPISMTENLKGVFFTEKAE